MNCYEAKIGDVVIGNKRADLQYAITRDGWIGIITNINYYNNTFTAERIDKQESFSDLNPNCFDFYPLTTAQELAKKLGFEMEVI